MAEALVPADTKEIIFNNQSADLKPPQQFFGSFLRLKRDWSLVLYQKKEQEILFSHCVKWANTGGSSGREVND